MMSSGSYRIRVSHSSEMTDSSPTASLRYGRFPIDSNLTLRVLQESLMYSSFPKAAASRLRQKELHCKLRHRQPSTLYHCDQDDIRR